VSIRLGTAALSRQIFAGRPNKSGNGFRGERHDVTSDVLKVVAEHIGMDREAVVCCDGEPAYFVRIESIATRRTTIAAKQDALEQYVADYEMCCDNGYYTPTGQERALIQDALHGWEYDRARLIADARAASGTSGSTQDAQRIDPKGAGPTAESGDAQ
jgi:hypothetical protein